MSKHTSYGYSFCYEDRDITVSYYSNLTEHRVFLTEEDLVEMLEELRKHKNE